MKTAGTNRAWHLLACAVALAIFPPTAGAAPPSPAEPAPYLGVTVRRPALLVRDMDRALALYRDILGFRVGQLGRDAPDSYAYIAFNIPRGTPVWHATLDTGSEQRVLALVAVPTMPRVALSGGMRSSAVLVNAAGRLAEIRQRLIAAGYKVLPSQPFEPNGIEFAFEDADGHLISVYEYRAC